MANFDFSIRKATISDAPFIAMGMIGALMIESTPEFLDFLATNICANDNTLYSWRNSHIVQSNGEDVGVLIAYNGENYLNMRSVTAQICDDKLPFDFLKQEPETIPGEFYIDSLWIKSEMRGNGLGTKVLLETIKLGKQKNLNSVTLVADFENHRALALYEGLGFVKQQILHLFGHNYHKLSYKLF